MTTTSNGVATSITVPSQALGAVEVRPETIITACEPLAGFPACVSYALVEHDHSSGSASRLGVLVPGGRAARSTPSWSRTRGACSRTTPPRSRTSTPASSS